MLELFFLHHAVDGFVGHLPSQEVDHEAIPPVGVVAKKDDGAIWRQVAHVLQSPARDGVKGVAGKPAEVDVEERIENVVFVGGNHRVNLGGVCGRGKASAEICFLTR